MCYHGVGTRAWGVNDLHPNRFRAQLERALERGWSFVPARKVADDTSTERRLAVTFDDGLMSVARYAAPILRDLQIPYTVFVVTSWAEGTAPWRPRDVMGWRELHELVESGGELASHSHTHRDFATLSAAEIAAEFEASFHLLDKRLGIRTDEFAIPFGQRANWSDTAEWTRKRSPYSYIYAQSDDKRPKGTIARTFVSRYDTAQVFERALHGAFAMWEEWV